MADCFNLYDINLVESAVLTPTTENVNFPVSNLKDTRRSKVYRSTSNSDSIVLDFQETSEINGIFLVPNKRDGFGVSTVTIEFNATDSWGSPAYTVSVPFSETVSLGHVAFTSIYYRFARIVMSSTLGYCELSKVFIGKSVPITASINFGWTIKDEELSVKSQNRYGQLFVDVIARQKVLGFAFKNVSKVDLDLINTVLDRVGESKPFYITIGNNLMTEDYRRFSGAVILTDIPTINNTSFGRYNLSLNVKELM